jgi:hypothetical protein
MIANNTEYNRSDAIKRASLRFYVDEQAVLVRNGLSTDLLCSRSDLSPARKSLLTEKIHDAMEYATAFTDVEELNALQYIAPSPVPNYYLTLGLYLYFADECSRLQTPMSFLSALREAKVALTIDDKPDADNFFQRCQKALEILGIADDRHMAILREWKERGTYSIQGDPHCNSEDGAVQGAYARLAREICRRQRYLGMNMAISYALGNKQVMAGSTPDDMIRITRETLQDTHLIDQRIHDGMRIREDRLSTSMQNVLQALPVDGGVVLPVVSASRARPIVEWLPDTALKIFEHERTVCYYADAPYIGTVYPAEDLPGLPHAGGDDVRHNKGQWLKRYRTIFMSNGYRQQPGDIAGDPQLKSAVAAQTLLHEITHMAIDILPQDRKDRLREKAAALSTQIRSQTLPDAYHQRLRTLDSNSLAEVMDEKSRLYTNYSNSWEEVACNTYALMHTEFAAQGGLSNLLPFTQPPAGLEALADYGREVSQAVEDALVLMQQKPEAPSQYKQQATQVMAARA